MRNDNIIYGFLLVDDFAERLVITFGSVILANMTIFFLREEGECDFNLYLPGGLIDNRYPILDLLAQV